MSEVLSNTPEKDLYYVAVKLLLRDGQKLLITHYIFGDWDLPGGRIRKDEFNSPLESVIERKINEELGEAATFELGSPAVFFKVERQEHDLNGQTVRIFGIGYNAQYKGGEIRLGEHHDKMEWVDIETFRPEDYFKGGWLAGVQEYIARLRT